jgi:translation initiation factor 3 subunit A
VKKGRKKMRRLRRTQMVLKKFIELSEAKVTEAQAKADEVQSSLDSTTTTQNIDDLEASETPESILLSTVSGEQSKDRTDRAIVTPWLKFLWETYRTVLDILKNNARLEMLYQSTAHQAFSFCQRYTRKTEFRRLCELLRNHLQNAAKYQSQPHSINLSDPDTLQRHLDTRFQQLNVAVELELWQEAFRSVEDIHTLLNLSKRPAKPLMMANYFEKLSTIFLVSENYLFHAAAYSRYLNLLRSSATAVATGQSSKKDNPTVTEADLTKNASFVILSALSIPVISTTRSRGALQDIDEARKNKNQRLTNLLGMSQAPSRAALFKEINARGLLKRARPEIRELYNILEVDFHPLSICKKISPILAQIGSDAELKKYVLPLQQVILTRLFQQLSQVYESVELKYVMNLAQFPEPFQVTSAMIEKFIMNGCKKGDLAIRIDHATGVLTFDSDVFSAAKALHPGSGAGSAETEVTAVQRLQITPAEIVRSQLTRLAKTLYVTCQYVDPSFNEELRNSRAAALERAESGMEKEHTETLGRRSIIENRKQTAASAAAEKAKEEEKRKRTRQQELQTAEVERLAQEERDRAQKRLEAEQARVQREELQKQLDELVKSGVKVDKDQIDIDNIDSQKIRMIKITAAEKEKNDLSEKLRITAKRIDHLERAFRAEELKHLPEDYDQQRTRDLDEYEKVKSVTLKDAEEKHKEDVALKRRLTRLVESYESFTKEIRNTRAADFEKRRRAAEKEYEEKKAQRIREHRARKQREREEAAARERAEREEAERQEREAEEKAAAEESKRAKMAEEKAKREEERAYVSIPINRVITANIIIGVLPTSQRSKDNAKQTPKQEQRNARRKVVDLWREVYLTAPLLIVHPPPNDQSSTYKVPHRRLEDGGNERPPSLRARQTMFLPMLLPPVQLQSQMSRRPFVASQQLVLQQLVARRRVRLVAVVSYHLIFATEKVGLLAATHLLMPLLLLVVAIAGVLDQHLETRTLRGHLSVLAATHNVVDSKGLIRQMDRPRSQLARSLAGLTLYLNQQDLLLLPLPQAVPLANIFRGI